MTLTVPVRLASELNTREHWTARNRRRKAQQAATLACLRAFAGDPPPLPVEVRLTRCGVRRMDSDNLAASCKHVRDEIARWLRVDDGSPLVAWHYAQESARRVRVPRPDGRVRTLAAYEVRIEVEPWNEAQGSALGAG